MNDHDHPSFAQLPLPFLSADELAAIDAACEVVERQQQKKWMTRHTAEAAELGRLADQLRRVLEQHAALYRANHPAGRPTPGTSTARGGTADQEFPTEQPRPPERTH